MKPVEINRHYLNENIPDEFFTPNIWDKEPREFIQIRMFINESYWKVKYSWKRSPKNYNIWRNSKKGLYLRKLDTPSKIDVLFGNLYTLYHQYYGKENKS